MGLPIVAAAAAGHGPAFQRHPTKLFVEVTSRCNLRCAMCPKQAPGGRDHDGDMDEAVFARLAPAFPHARTLLLNGIGEPLLHPGLERFVELARREMPATGTIGFQSNGQLLSAARSRSLVCAGVDQVCLSADAVVPDDFARLRGGGAQSAVEAGLEHLHAASSAIGRRLELGVEFVAMRDNLDQLPALVRWAARRHVEFIIVTHVVPYAEGLAGAAAFEAASDASREHFESWQARAAAQGVDLARYQDVFMRFRLSAGDREVVRWVRDMVEDGARKGLTLHLARLFAADPALRPRVEAAFEAAAEEARTLGVDLHLPAAGPSSQRRCDFVEEGSAFVTWDGRVHPCYFLWHRSRCFLGGTEKQVAPLAFGDLKVSDVLSIWNGSDFTAFRGEVVRYDYPFCHDCNAALCADVRGEHVEDCHLGAVPCAACMWCTGVFQCLR